jgi:hypothetical protein
MWNLRGCSRDSMACLIQGEIFHRVMSKTPKPQPRTGSLSGGHDTLVSAESRVAIQKAKIAVGRIMYIECKAGTLNGSARVGRVTFSKSGRTLYYNGLTFQSLKGAGFKANFYCVQTGDSYWISGPKRRGGDRLYGSVLPVEVDEDIRAEYWRDIRGLPGRIDERIA